LSHLRLLLLVLLFFCLISCEKDDPIRPTEFPPVLSNLTAPDTVLTGIDQSYIFSVKCDDENGLDDIDSVVFRIEANNGQLIISGIMFDDGNYEDHGDNIPNDGKYGIRLIPQLPGGNYRFVVQATDLSNMKSDPLENEFYAVAGIINHAPEISIYQIPDSVVVDEIVPFVLRVRASDPDSQDYISKVSYQILGPTITEMAEEGELNDDGANGDSLAGDGIFSIETSTLFANWKFGSYYLQIQAFDSHQKSSNSITKNIPWKKIKLGVPPQVISVTAPDTVQLPASGDKSFLLTAYVTDEDNNADVREVSFNSYKPSGIPSGGNPFKMYDDGTSGDRIAGDNIFSLLIWITSQNSPGDYRFDFQAIDYSNLLSNSITHTITVIE